MERDVRRGRDQWRGCHSFKNIVCDGDQVGNTSRNGGLKMGQTYYYYYELDGSTETYDPAHPTTNACPFLPGQTVNTLEIPQERSNRFRSASTNSLRSVNFKTMDPRDRFTAPRPAPSAPGASELRAESLPSSAYHDDARSARSLSPAPKWTGAARRLFGFKHAGRDEDRGRSRASDLSHAPPEFERVSSGARSVTPSGSVRSRDMSPESLRRFLSDDVPYAPSTAEPAPKLWIPDEITEENEDNEDDDNFATSAASESAPVTMLSPPPTQRKTSSPPLSRSKNESTATIVPQGPLLNVEIPSPSVESRGSTSDSDANIIKSSFSCSTASSPTSPISQPTKSRDRNNFSFLDDSDDDEDYVSSRDNDMFNPHDDKGRKASLPRAPFANYSLPYHTLEANKHTNRQPQPTLGSPELIARNENGVPVGNTNLLSLPHIDSGLDDLANEISWIADVVRPKDF